MGWRKSTYLKNKVSDKYGPLNDFVLILKPADNYFTIVSKLDAIFKELSKTKNCIDKFFIILIKTPIVTREEHND